MWTRRSPEAALWLALVAGPALAQGLDARAERERIGSERARVEAQATAERKACQAQFAVAACVARVDAERRDRLRALDRQRALLAEAQRKERAVAREARTAERGRIDTPARAEPIAPTVKSAAPVPRPAAPEAPARAEARAHAASAADAQAARRVQASQRRAAELEVHRAAVEKRNRDAAGKRKPGVALPVSAPR